MRTRFAIALVCLAMTADVLVAPSAASQLSVLISGGFSAAYREVLPTFERTSGIDVTTTSGGSIGSGPNTIPGQLRRGVEADVIILAREGMRDLMAEHLVLEGTDVDLARSVIGLVVRAGAPKPDISTVDNLKKVLVDARSVAVSSSTSGVYLTTTLFPKLGIGEQMAAKTSMAGAALVGRGEADVGLQQVSELLPIAGTQFVGRIPDEVQYVTTYAAAIGARSENRDNARSLIAFLSSDGVAEAIRRSGMEPVARP